MYTIWYFIIILLYDVHKSEVRICLHCTQIGIYFSTGYGKIQAATFFFLCKKYVFMFCTEILT